MLRIGLWMIGPSPLANSRWKPSGSRIKRISAKRIAASTPSTSAAVTVTSVASSGDLQSSRNETLDRTAWYSDMYRPACRMSQMGVTGVGSRRQAFMKGLFHSSSDIGRSWETEARGMSRPFYRKPRGTVKNLILHRSQWLDQGETGTRTFPQVDVASSTAYMRL